MENDDPVCATVTSKEVPIPSEVKDLLNLFTAQLKQVDPDFLEGLYLTGSLTQSDFQSFKSDVDFIVLCKELPDRFIQDSLARIHISIEKKFPKTPLNGWYVTREGLTLNLPSKKASLMYEKSRLQPNSGITPVTVLELKSNGICIYGKSISTLAIKVTRKDVVEYLFENINSYWANWLDRHSKWSRSKLLLLLFPRLSEWVLLGVARQYYTLKTGTITSKSHAGDYAIQFLPEEYHNIMVEAVNIRKDDQKHVLALKTSYSIKPSFERCIKTIACARHIIRQFNNEHQTTHSNV